MYLVLGIFHVANVPYLHFMANRSGSQQILVMFGKLDVSYFSLVYLQIEDSIQRFPIEKLHNTS